MIVVWTWNSRWPESVTLMSCWAASRHQRTQKAPSPLWKTHIRAVRTLFFTCKTCKFYFYYIHHNKENEARFTTKYVALILDFSQASGVTLSFRESFSIFVKRLMGGFEMDTSVEISESWSDLWPCSSWSPWCCGAPARSELSTCSLQHGAALWTYLLFYTARSRSPSARSKQQRENMMSVLLTTWNDGMVSTKPPFTVTMFGVFWLGRVPWYLLDRIRLDTAGLKAALTWFSVTLSLMTR